MAQWKTKPFGNIDFSSLFGEFECEIGQHLSAKKTAFAEEQATSNQLILNMNQVRFIYSECFPPEGDRCFRTAWPGGSRLNGPLSRLQSLLPAKYHCYGTTGEPYLYFFMFP
jgi:hypothetical protein